jgi:uncharacterized protein (DUF58 family)
MRGMTLAPEEYLRPDVIQQVQQLDLRAKFIVEGFLAGLHRSPYHGFSVEFSEHRRYSPGDDLRLIDWNVYAKTDRYFVKKFQAETNLQAYLLMDCSGSMDFRSSDERMTKMDYAICLAAAMGFMAINQQDPLGLFMFDQQLRQFLPPRSKRSHLQAILTTLARTRPYGPTRLADCLHAVAERIARRSLIILLSDLLEEPDALEDALHHLRHAGHDLVIFQVLDQAERQFQFDGEMEFHDPETAQTTRTDAAAIRSAYLEALETHIETCRQLCRSVQADFVSIDNAMTFDKALLQFLVQRQKR